MRIFALEMKERVFRFKQFSVRHAKSAMKVGVDGVLIGAWATTAAPDNAVCKVLDAGCGCGLIALMIAQRNPMAQILAIDIDSPSVEEATKNVEDSPWSDRIIVEMGDFKSIVGKFDHIISNPPFFESGLAKPATPRETARHSTDGFGPMTLIVKSCELLSAQGILSIIVPAQQSDYYINEAERRGLALHRRTVVFGRKGTPPKRVLLEFSMGGDNKSLEDNKLDIEVVTPQGEWAFSPEYLKLCSEFYLKF